jgi:hypothetical protein
MPDASSTGTDAALAVTGYAGRSDGRSTVWINDRAQPAQSVERDGSIVVTLPGDRGRVRVKVGQSVDLSSGTVNESYRRAPAIPQPSPGTARTLTEPAFRLHRKRVEDLDGSPERDRP